MEGPKEKAVKKSLEEGVEVTALVWAEVLWVKAPLLPLGSCEVESTPILLKALFMTEKGSALSIAVGVPAKVFPPRTET